MDKILTHKNLFIVTSKSTNKLVNCVKEITTKLAKEVRDIKVKAFLHYGKIICIENGKNKQQPAVYYGQAIQFALQAGDILIDKPILATQQFIDSVSNINELYTITR